MLCLSLRRAPRTSQGITDDEPYGSGREVTEVNFETGSTCIWKGKD